jgi:hypothetical protein
MRRLSRPPHPAPSTCDFMYNRQRSPLQVYYGGQKQKYYCIWPPPPQLFLQRRAALTNFSNGTQSGEAGGRSRYYSHVYGLYTGNCCCYWNNNEGQLGTSVTSGVYIQRCICIMDPLKGHSLLISSCSSLHRQAIGATNSSSYIIRGKGKAYLFIAQIGRYI